LDLDLNSYTSFIPNDVDIILCIKAKYNCLMVK
jgi:hypothetical protein